ncbi:putative vacuolar (H+)-ATPase G subunit [Helianthus anomalus]
MDVSRGQNGIQLLLTAEQEAQQITGGDLGDNVKGLEKETEAKIQQLKTKADIFSNDVVDMLLKNVTSVKYWILIDLKPEKGFINILCACFYYVTSVD